MSGYEIIIDIGVTAIRAKSQHQTQRLIELASEAGLPFNGILDPKQRGGVVFFDVSIGKAVTAEVLKTDILVDYRPHFYTTDQELEQSIHEMRTISEAFSAAC